MSSKFTWPEFWGLWAQAPPNLKEQWSVAVGFLIKESESKVFLDPRLRLYLDKCSITDMEQFLTGAPIQIVQLYLHFLPINSAKKIIKGFRMTDVPLLRAAYNNPPQIAGPKKP